VELTRGLEWLEKSPSWTKADQEGMKKWFALISIGANEQERQGRAAAKNNHGTWYDAQIVSLALATGQKDLAKKTLEAAKKKRIESEIKEDVASHSNWSAPIPELQLDEYALFL